MTDGSETPANAPAPRTARTVLAGLASLVVLLFAFLAGAVGLMLAGRPLPVPEPVVDLVERQISRAFGLGPLALEGLELAIVRDRLEPELRLRGVRLTGLSPVGLSLPEVRVRLSAGDLLSGRAVVREVHVTGGRLVLLRGPDGRLMLGTEEPGGTTGTSGGGLALGGLVQRLDALLERPELVELRWIGIEGVTILYQDLGTGRGLRLEGERFRFRRAAGGVEADGALAVAALNGSGRRGRMNAHLSRDRRSGLLRARLRIAEAGAREVAVLSPALAWLSTINAPITGALATDLAEDGRVLRLEGTLRIGAGRLLPEGVVKGIAFREAGVLFGYSPARRRLLFREIRVQGPELSLEGEGHADLVFPEGGGLPAYVAQFAFSEGSIGGARFLARPVGIEAVSADMRVRLSPFRVELGAAHLALAGGHGQFWLKGETAVAGEGWHTRLDLTAEGLDRSGLLSVWPLTRAPGSRNWVEKNVLAGRIDRASAALRLRSGQPPELAATFAFRDARVRVLRDFPVATGVSGHASYAKRRFTLTAESARIAVPGRGEVDFSGTSFTVPDTRRRPTLGIFELQAKGDLSAGLDLLDRPPIRALSRVGRGPELATGRFEGRAEVRRLLRRGLGPRAVRFRAEATVQELRSTTLINGLELAAPRAHVVADNRRVRISAQGAISGVPLAFSWEAALDPPDPEGARLEARLELSPRANRALRLGLPEWLLSGATTLELGARLAAGGPVRFAFGSDLRGLGLAIPPLGWRKPAAARGRLEGQGMLEQGRITLSSLEMQAAGLSLSGTLAADREAGLKAARFSRLAIAPWLSVRAELIGRGPGRPPLLAVRGGRVDLSVMPAGSRAAGPPGGEPMPLEVALDELVISDGLRLTALSGRLQAGRGLEGPFRAHVNGGPVVEGRLVPAAYGARVRIVAGDAGAVLAAAGIYRNGQGGLLELHLRPEGKPGFWQGRLHITDIRVRNAPVLAQLLQAVSVVGLIEQLTGPGIPFAEVEGRFRVTPTGISIRDGRATGASLGLSAEGVYLFEGRRIDLRGTISPIYLVNNILGALSGSRRGEGAIAFSYRIRGPVDRPRITVNPLSALAPGFLREMFRGKPPQLPPATN